MQTPTMRKKVGIFWSYKTCYQESCHSGPNILNYRDAISGRYFGSYYRPMSFCNDCNGSSNRPAPSPLTTTTTAPRSLREAQTNYFPPRDQIGHDSPQNGHSDVRDPLQNPPTFVAGTRPATTRQTGQAAPPPVANQRENPRNPQPITGNTRITRSMAAAQNPEEAPAPIADLPENPPQEAQPQEDEADQANEPTALDTADNIVPTHKPLSITRPSCSY